jgi:hypothetical protein
MMNEITQFRCVLPPTCGSIAFTGTPTGAAAVLGSDATPDRLIAHSLGPLRDELNAALLRDDQNGALTLAYTALARVADALAAWQSDSPQPQRVRVHALLVELETLPLEPLPDGTVIEHGTAVTVNYQSWMIERGVAAAWAQTLTERFGALWPGAWIVVGANE